MTTRGDLDPFAETDDVRRHHLPDALIPDPNVPSGLDDPGSLEEPPRLIVPIPRRRWASIARMVQRCQEVHRRTWCSSRPVRPLPVWKDFSMAQRRPATNVGRDTAVRA